jgi:hypothetical protein
MNILGYIVQFFNEECFMPETGYKHLFKSFSQALEHAKMKFQDYVMVNPDVLEGYYDLYTPAKKQADENGYVVVFRSPDVQIWIEVIVE